MTEFRNQSFTARLGSMGDEAEGMFEKVHPSGYVRFGLNRPPISMRQLPAAIRHIPDYLTSNCFVEVQGVGRDRKLKLKIEKAIALQQWHQTFHLKFFVWDTTKKDYKYLEWEHLWLMLPTMPIAYFSDNNKPYWEVDVDEHIWSVE